MLVTNPNEALSASCEGGNPDASRASEKVEKRESVRNIHIGGNGLLSSVSQKNKNVTLSECRKECLVRYFSLYPEGGKVRPLGAEECFAESGVSGLYQTMKLSEEEAQRISVFEKDLEKRWYVFRLNYNCGGEALDDIDIADCDFYVPDVKRKIKVKGQKMIVSDPYLRSLFFAYTTRRIAEILHASPLIPHARIYYNHFQKDTITGYDAPLTIPHSQMLDFMLIAEAKSFDMKILDPEKVKIPQDVFVEVTDGPFKGVQGFLTHVSGKQRVVSKTGFCIIATGYISSYGYKVIDKKTY